MITSAADDRFIWWLECVIHLCRLQIERERMTVIGKFDLKRHIEDAKQRKAKLEARAAAAVASYHGASDLVESAIAGMERDAAELQAEVAHLTNGGPPLDDTPEQQATPVPPLVRGYPV